MRFDPADEALLCRAIPRVISGNFGLRVRAGGDRGYEQYYSDQPATFEVMDTDSPEDTAMPARRFKTLVGEKLNRLDAIRDYPLSCRTDVDFRPDILLSFREGAADSGAEIALYASEDGVEIRYDAARCSDRYIAAFASALETLCAAMDGDAPLRDIPLVETRAEGHVISLKNEGTVNAILARMAREQPEKRVLTAVDGAMTLHALDRAANRIGNALIARGIRPHDRVLLLMRRTRALVACVFGVLKAGAAFIPMDPSYPRERIKQILEDSDAALIITDVPEVASGFSRCVAPEDLVSDDDTAPDVEVTPDDLCFIIYTSGTTGRPKGVALSHRGISNYIVPEPENAPIHALATRCRGMLCLSSVSFIVFLREIFGTILNPGAKGVIDVSLRDAGDEVVISLRDMGAGFNPTVPDPALQCESDNVTVLNRLAGAIEFDRSLGMNATRIHLKK